MGESNKKDIKTNITSAIKAVGSGAAKGTKVGIDAVLDGANHTVKGAAKAKDAIDGKVREVLDKAYEAKREHAVNNLARLRSENPNASPSEVLDLLEAELKEFEKDSGADSEKFLSSTGMFVFTAVELYPSNAGDFEPKQKLIDAVVMLDSAVAKNVAMFGGLAIGLLVARVGVVGKAAGKLAKMGSKVKWVAPLLAIAGLKNPGMASAAWAVNAATRKILGEAPENWPPAK